MSKLKYIIIIALTIIVFLFVPLIGMKKEISNKSSIKLDKEMNMYYIKDTDQEYLLKINNAAKYYGKLEDSKDRLLIRKATQERNILLAKQVKERIAKEKKIAKAKRIKEEKRKAELAAKKIAEEAEKKRLAALEVKRIAEKETKKQIAKKDEKTVVVSRGNASNYTEAYYEITAYTAGVESTGKSKGDKGYGLTASGNKVQQGKTIACPKNFAFGTKVHIEGYGMRVCHDTGSAIGSGKIDLYMNNLSDAQNFGRITLKVKIYK